MSLPSSSLYPMISARPKGVQACAPRMALRSLSPPTAVVLVLLRICPVAPDALDMRSSAPSEEMECLEEERARVRVMNMFLARSMTEGLKTDV